MGGFLGLEEMECPQAWTAMTQVSRMSLGAGFGVCAGNGTFPIIAPS